MPIQRLPSLAASSEDTFAVPGGTKSRVNVPPLYCSTVPELVPTKSVPSVAFGEPRGPAVPEQRRVARGEGDEARAVEADEAGGHAQPDIAVARLEQGIDGVAGQVGRAPARDHVLRRAALRVEGQGGWGDRAGQGQHERRATEHSRK
jgi:hypothetical protein